MAVVVRNSLVQTLSVQFDKIPVVDMRKETTSVTHRTHFSERLAEVLLAVVTAPYAKSDTDLWTLRLNDMRAGLKERFRKDASTDLRLAFVGVTCRCCMCPITTSATGDGFPSETSSWGGVQLNEKGRQYCIHFGDYLYMVCSEKCREAFLLTPMIYE